MTTAAQRHKLVDIFLRAAEIQDDRIGHHAGCCLAIDKVQGGETRYESAAHKAFNEAFPWQGDIYVLLPWRHGIVGDPDYRHYPESARQARVLALLFCAEMARRGEIG